MYIYIYIYITGLLFDPQVTSRPVNRGTQIFLLLLLIFNKAPEVNFTECFYLNFIFLYFAHPIQLLVSITLKSLTVKSPVLIYLLMRFHLYTFFTLVFLVILLIFILNQLYIIYYVFVVNYEYFVYEYFFICFYYTS